MYIYNETIKSINNIIENSNYKLKLDKLKNIILNNSTIVTIKLDNINEKYLLPYILKRDKRLFYDILKFIIDNKDNLHFSFYHFKKDIINGVLLDYQEEFLLYLIDNNHNHHSLYLLLLYDDLLDCNKLSDNILLNILNHINDLGFSKSIRYTNSINNNICSTIIKRDVTFKKFIDILMKKDSFSINNILYTHNYIAYMFQKDINDFEYFYNKIGKDYLKEQIPSFYFDNIINSLNINTILKYKKYVDIAIQTYFPQFIVNYNDNIEILYKLFNNFFNGTIDDYNLKYLYTNNKKNSLAMVILYNGINKNIIDNINKLDNKSIFNLLDIKNMLYITKNFIKKEFDNGNDNKKYKLLKLIKNSYLLNKSSYIEYLYKNSIIKVGDNIEKNN